MAKKIQISYEAAYARLQEIQQAVEDNQMNVDQLGDALKEVGELLKICKEKLFAIDSEAKRLFEDNNND